MQRLLAFLCQVCPFCVARRACPDSAYARFMERVERNCPACRAYDALHGVSPCINGADTDRTGGGQPSERGS